MKICSPSSENRCKLWFLLDGDQYPYRGADFTALGVTYQQALANYIIDALAGVISAGDYPEGGEGRISN